MRVAVLEPSNDLPRGAPAAPASAETPPPGLPGEHFAAALAFLVAGSVGLVLVAPDLANGAFFVPQVVAVVHLFTLGWIVLSIFGALCQFLPVAVGRPLRWRALAHLTFGLQALGAAALVGGLLSGRRAVLWAGALSLASAFLLFASNLAATLASVHERSLTWWALAGASVFLVVTPTYGVLLACNLHDGLLGVDRFEFVAAHAHVALLGVVLLVIAGVAHHLLPMFLLSHGASERPGWIAVALLFTAAMGLSIPFGGAARFAASGLVAGAGVVAFLVQTASFFRHRKRRAIDPGMRLAAAGLVGLAAALLLAPFAMTAGFDDVRLVTTYLALALGAITLFVAGHYLKIVPFLVWYHRFGPLVGLREVPRVADLYSPEAALAGGALLAGGWLGLVGSIFAGAPSIARAAAAVFTAGALTLALVLARVARRRPA
jgi:hypothetical protein